MKKLVGLVLLCAISSCKVAAIKVENRNIEIAKIYFNEVWNKGNVALLDDLLSPDYINHTPSSPNPKKGAEGLKPIVLKTRKIFKNLNYEIKDITATKDKVVIRTVMTGIHSDTLFGIPPTGKRIEVNQINIEKIKDGKIVEHWRITDQLKMMQQLK